MLIELLPADGSAAYTETNLNNLFPEPWNMVTSALFLMAFFYVYGLGADCCAMPVGKYVFYC